MRHTWKYRLLAALLAVCTMFSVCLPAQAATIADGSKTVTVHNDTRHNYLTTTAGNTIGGGYRYYKTNDGITGPAYCIDWGLAMVPSSKRLTIAGRYLSSPKTMGAFANGYPQRSLADFLELYSGDYPMLNGLTEDELAYATQIAVWASLGQIGVEGTSFTAGRATIPAQSNDAQKVRVYTAVTIILKNADSWSKPLYTGMYLRTEKNKLGNVLEIEDGNSLETAAERNLQGIQKENIGGREYYTREFWAASATSTWPFNYCIGVWLSGAPSGTLVTDMENHALPLKQLDGGGNVFLVPTEYQSTSLNINGSEYSGAFKLCLPVENTTQGGEVGINLHGVITQFDIYLATNPTASEQSYIIADPGYGVLSASGKFIWGGTEGDELARVIVTKVDGANTPLAGAKFSLEGSDGSSHTGTTGADGTVAWEDLAADASYTLRETQAPEGYAIVDPVNVTVEAGRTSYVTVRNTEEKVFRVKKVDAQNGYSLRGAVFRFEQIDGGYTTTGTTGHDGMIEFIGDALPFGSYRVTEVQPPEGYKKDTRVQTVEWDGKADVLLTFQNIREPSLVIYKTDPNGVSLPGASFKVYKDGKLITTVESDDAGAARVSGLSEGYYEVEEITAPEGFVLDSTRHGVHIDPYDPATEDDPVLTIVNEAKPSLRIVKYDRQSGKPLAGVTFEVYRDTVLVGNYTTDDGGEILLSSLTPGTYAVKEVAAPGTHVVNSSPQQIELKAGNTETATLIFFNSMKPGIHLVKVDSETMKPLPNATYLISQVGGTFSKEYTTDLNGEIDLTGLEPGAYTVKEVKAPDGYLMDDGSRIVQINPDENAQFVFTDTRKPSLVVVKYDPQNNKYLAGATFRIAKVEDGSHYLDRVTDTKGRIDLTGLEPGVYSVQELSAPEGYIKNDSEYHVELFPGKTSELVVVNEALPNLKIIKTDAITGEPVAGVIFTVRKADSATLSTVTTGPDGTAELLKLEPGVYEVTEQSVPGGYLLDETPQLITLVPGKTGVVQFQNYPRPALEIIKTDTSARPIPDAVFTVAKKDGTLVGDFSTGQDGKIHVYDLDAGYYIITEKSVLAPYILDTTPHEVLMVEGKATNITIENKRLPDLTVAKKDSITGDPLQGAKFTVWYAPGSLSGDLREMGNYSTDENGVFVLKAVEPGWYRVTETEPPAGYAVKEPSTLDVFMEADQDKTLTFENQPLNSLVIKKVDATDGHVLQGAKFRVRYFEGVTGTGGTTIGEYETSTNGTIVITGLKAGTYIVEETHAPAGYIIDDAPKTVYLSGKEQAAVTVEFANQPDSGLTITKLDSMTKEPLAGAVFEIRNSAGAVVGNSNGRYTTDEGGTIHLPGLPTDTYTVREVQAPNGYVLSGEPQTVKLIHGETHRLTFYNVPKGALVIVKQDVETKKPLAGATFKVTTSSGEFVAAQGGAVSSNGLYTTDKSGQIVLTGLEPDTYVVSEYKAPSGYELDSTLQTVEVNAHDTQTLYFYDSPTPEGGLRIVKLDEETRQPIRGVEFEVTHMDGKRLGTYRTDSKGVISLPELAPGWYTVTERKAADGYELDAQPRDVEVKDNKTATLEVTNRQRGSAIIHKIDGATGEGIYGVTFLVSDARGNPVGQYTSDQDGYVYIDGELKDGKYTIREIEAAEGYVSDTAVKTFYVEYGGCSTITWENTAVKGQIQIVKKSADYNPTNGLPAGTLLEGARFEVRNERTGRLVDTIVSGRDGLAVSKQLPLGRYILREVQAPVNYAPITEEFTAVLEYSGQIVRFEVLNKSVSTGVSITKTGPKEAVSGQPVRYVFSGISNTGNISLESFYWRDTLPAAVTLNKVVTGTYNFPGTYKIVYKVNGAGDYRTLADNLSTAKNYTFDAGPAALGLAANERVTEVMFVFGQAPGGFSQVEAPALHCTAVPGLAAGSSFTNVAEAGGVYNGQWIQAVTRWVTTVYGKPVPLPRTGY